MAPSYIQLKYKGNIRKTNEDEYHQFRLDCQHADKVNKEKFEQAKDEWAAIMRALLAYYGRDSNEVKYFRTKGPKTPTFSHDKIWRKFQNAYFAEMGRRDRLEKSRQYHQRVKQATIALESVGFEKGKDFGGKVITFARQHLTETEDGFFVAVPPDKENHEDQ